jgi:hypothetical protein
VSDQEYQHWLSGIAHVAQESDDPTYIKRGGHPIAENAKQNSQS